MTTPSSHDIALGHLDHCQVCGSSALRPALDLGYMSPCDSLLTAAQLREPEQTFPLRLIRCEACGLAQIDHIVPPDVLFHREYPYRSGITPVLVKNLQGTATRAVERYGVPAGSLCMDIGSNDGTLLKGFQSVGMRVLGIEATNVAAIAVADGVPTIQAFFGEALARKVVAEHGQASIITATNMFAHVSNLGDMMRGISALLKDGGAFVTESHYLVDLLETLQYDSIYHEHLKYYCMRPLIRLFEAYGFTVTDVERIPNYGGSIRVYAEKGLGRPVGAAVGELIAMEEREGIYDGRAYERFAERVRKARLDLMDLLVDLARAGTPAPGIGCPGRAATLLNYSKVDTDLMPYIAEQSTSLKLGLFLPNAHIPVVDEARLFAEQPDYAVMLSWHYWEPIVAKLRARGLRSKIILPLPDVLVLQP